MYRNDIFLHVKASMHEKTWYFVHYIVLSSSYLHIFDKVYKETFKSL